MGRWTFSESKLENLLPLRSIALCGTRTDHRQAPATGNYAVHVREQERLMREALVID
jgi:2-oxoglutarate dehydrogenase complex dehydrogenase (E1) component-like enzyme